MHPGNRLSTVRFLGGAALSISMLLAAAAPALAAEPVSVSMFPCFLAGGETTVPAGADLTIQSGWGARTRGQINSFLASVSTEATLDGEPIVGSFGSPEGSRADGWSVFWNYSTDALDAGDTIEVSVEQTLAFPVFDGDLLFPAGSLGQMTCTITGV
jgi:hypothetical protein